MLFHTAVKHNLPVVTVISNDQAWGMCKRAQKTYGRAGSGDRNRVGIGLATAVSPTGEGIKGFIVSEMDTALTIGMTGNREAIEKSLKKWEAISERVAGTKKAADPRLTEGKAPLAHLLSIGLGIDISPDMLLETSARVRHLQRAFEIREGLNRADDKLGKGFYRDMKSDRDKETKVSLAPEELEKLKDEYYQLRGWDLETGAPTRETLERFGLKEVADDLERHGKLP